MRCTFGGVTNKHLKDGEWELLEFYPGANNVKMELAVTFQYIQKYELCNVRGAYLTRINEPTIKIDMRRYANFIENKCCKCVKSGHFVKTCPKKNKTVTKFLIG